MSRRVASGCCGIPRRRRCLPLRLLLALLALLAALPLLAAPSIARAERPACATPPDLLDSWPLPQTATAIATGRLRVLAVGSASVLGPGSSGPDAAWPARLDTLLGARLPGVAVQVEARGGRGLTAPDQWAMIAEAVRRDRPDLVLWQAAATEAMRGLETSDLTDTLLEGLERLGSLGIDTVLIDLQFSRFLRAHADIEPYREALRAAGAAHGAPLFRRYDLMQAWTQAGTVDVERAPRAARQQAVDALNDCLARAMAAFILDGVADARR